MTVETALTAVVTELVSLQKLREREIQMLGVLERTINELRLELQAWRLQSAGVTVPGSGF